MSEKNTIARPYAKAIFEIAQGEHQLSEWSEMLMQVAMITQDFQMVYLLKHPGFSSKDSVDLILSLVSGLSLKMKEAVAFIGENKRLLFMPEIASLFEGLRREAERVVNVVIISAVPLNNDSFAKKITQTLKDRLGRDVLLQFETDQGIIGGAIIKTGDLVIDGSIKGRLAQLCDALGV